MCGGLVGKWNFAQSEGGRGLCHVVCANSCSGEELGKGGGVDGIGDGRDGKDEI